MSSNAAVKKSRTLTGLAPWLPAAAILMGCGADGGDESAEPFYRSCTEAVVAGELTLVEARCVCRTSVQRAEEFLRQCSNDYEAIRAECDAVEFGGYVPDCSVRLDDWSACRDMLLGASSCEAAEAAAASDMGGCRTLMEELDACGVRN